LASSSPLSDSLVPTPPFWGTGGLSAREGSRMGGAPIPLSYISRISALVYGPHITMWPLLNVSFIVSSVNQRCLQQRKGPVRLSARDPFERFSTLLTRLQSQQISGMQSYSARYKYSGIRTYFNNLFGGASPSGLKFLVEIFWRSGLLPLSFYKQTKHPTD